MMDTCGRRMGMMRKRAADMHSSRALLVEAWASDKAAQADFWDLGSVLSGV